MSDSLANEQRDIYRKNFQQHGDKPEGMFWNNKETQYLRFERLLKNLDLSSSFSVHDIGCGTADLHQYLLEKKVKHNYHGTDLVPEMIAAAKKKFPDIKLFERDVLKDKSVEVCDYVIVSGTFNLRGKTDEKEWNNYVFRLMKRAYEISSKGVAFNFLNTYKTFSDPTLAYFNPQEVFDFCMKNFSRFVILDHSYPLFEFTTTIFKADYMKSRYDSSVYGKYFGK